MSVIRGAFLAAVLAAGHAPTNAGELARRVLEGGGYQRDLPSGPPPPDPVDPSSSWSDLELPQLLAYAAIAVAVAVGVAWVVRRLASGGPRDVALPADAPAPLEVALARPEALAAAGRWAEAIHALLLETLAALSRAAQLPSSYTSREILQRVRLPTPARAALEALVLAVEISRFGGVAAGEADYRSCLARFHEFLATHRGPAREAA